MRHKLHARLVSARPPKEKAGETATATMQELFTCGASVVAVPQDNDDAAERCRTLLLYDAALTPPEFPGAYGVAPWALDAARLARAAKAAGITPHEKPSVNALQSAEREVYKRQDIQQNAAAARYALTSGFPLNNHPKARDLLARPMDSWSDCIEAARWLTKLAEQNNEKQTPPPPQGGEGDEGDSDEGDGFSDELQAMLDSLESDKQAWEQDNGQGEGDEAGGESQGATQPPKPRKKTPPPSGWHPSAVPPPKERETLPGILENADRPDSLPMLPKRKRGGKRRPELEGAFPKASHRKHIDGKVYQGAIVRGGSRGRGTILVDLSGSMNWEVSDFEALVSVLPECTVYGYAGRDTRGRWVILADRGRAADPKAIYAWQQKQGWNVVDAPCLQTLARLPAPRVWISDGQVNGRHGNSGPYYEALCKEAVERGNITRVRTAHDAAALITGVKRAVYT